MKNFILLLILGLPAIIYSQSYSQDKSEIYTANNEVEELLNTANNILCIISKIKAEEFIDKGPYKAQVFDTRCDVAGARADAQASAQGGNQNNNNQNNNEVELASDMIVDVKSAFSEIRNQDYLEVKSWFYQKGDYSEAQPDYEGMWDAEPDQLIYALTKVWSGATEEDPNGELVLDFVVESNCQNAPYQSYEEAQQAALDLGYTEGTENFWRETDKFWRCPPVGTQRGSGRLDTTDNKVLFLGPNGRSIILSENDSGRDGIWKTEWWECIIDGKHVDYQDQESAGCGEHTDLNPNWYAVEALYGFSYDETSKASCKKLIRANRRQGTDSGPTVTDITDEWKAIDWNLESKPWMAENGPAQMINETCESTSASDAKLAVWEYGLYTTSDDLRYDMKNPGFELKSEEEFQSPYDEDRTESIYAWADYWGTHVDENRRSNVTDTTVFKKVNSDDTNSYYLKQKKISLRKMTVDKVSLNSLSGVELNLHIEWDRNEVGVNCWWNDKKKWGGTNYIDDDMDNNSNGEDDRCNIERWRDLGVPVDSVDDEGNPFNIFLGYWDAAYATGGSTPVGTFVFDKAVKEVNNRWVAEVDITPFTFTPEEYLVVWDDDRVYDLNNDNGYEVWRNLWAHGRGQGYEIKADALQAPSSDLVNRRTEKDISVSELAGKTLGCIERCLSGAGMQAYFSEALTLIATGTAENPASGTVTSPYSSPAILGGDASAVPTGPYVRAGADKGQWTQQGVLTSEIMQYEPSGETIAVVAALDASQTPLQLPSEMYELNDPWSKFEQKICIREPNQASNEQGRDCWGMKNHMTLFDMAKVAEVRCDLTRDTDNDDVYDAYEYHSDSTVQSSEEFRHCADKLWKMTEFYEVNWDPYVNYQVFDGSDQLASLVEISRPEAVTLTLPNEEKFGDDAGRKKTLEYGGFGRLWGFEWTNFNIKTWTDLGEYLDWDTLSEEDRNYVRGFPTYVIPDGTIIMGEDGITELKSKFLRGEYYLKPLPSAVGTNLYTTNVDALEGQQPEVYETSFIGPVPENSLLLNEGNACVDHGEILSACATSQ
tara:strand:- start:1280 stop:4441 length:3162 start_codon:yes stop_codon:yes gene_type:complete